MLRKEVDENSEEVKKVREQHLGMFFSCLFMHEQRQRPDPFIVTSYDCAISIDCLAIS